MEKPSEKYNKIIEDVRSLMEKDDRCRENDLWLCVQFWREIQKAGVFIPYPLMSELVTPETISRARRKIQEAGDLLPENPEVIIRRKIRENVVRNYFANKPGLLSRWEALYEKLDRKEGVKRFIPYGKR